MRLYGFQLKIVTGFCKVDDDDVSESSSRDSDGKDPTSYQVPST